MCMVMERGEYVINVGTAVVYSDASEFFFLIGLYTLQRGAWMLAFACIYLCLFGILVCLCVW